jgi:hypothetical protein
LLLFSGCDKQKQQVEEFNMKAIVTVAILSLVTAAPMMAQSPRQVGDWSIYNSAGNQTKNHMVLVQTTAVGEHLDATGNSVPVKLDIICKNKEIVAIAVETGSKIDERAVSDSQAVPTTAVAFAVDGQVSRSENWAVADGGRTLSPYSELFQAKLNRTWVERINGTEKIAFRLNQKEGDDSLAPTFNTAQLSEALQSAGCTE